MGTDCVNRQMWENITTYFLKQLFISVHIEITTTNSTTVIFFIKGETDWKMIGIDVEDELAPKLNDIEDIETHMPGFLAATVEWFKIYKMPDGKPPNEFAFEAKPKGREFALEIIKSLNDQWKMP